MAVTMRRWRCKVCKKGVIAPHRPPADDIRRLCLPCTKRKNKLVFRVLVVREAKRKAKSKPAQPTGKHPQPRRLKLGKKEVGKLFDVEWAD